MNIDYNPSTVDKRNESYFSRLDDRLSAIAKTQDCTFLDIVSASRGAFPTLVKERLRILGIDVTSERKPERSSQESIFLGPELHPLDFEWYFTAECADKLAKLLIDFSGEILCMAAPTVANAIARRGRKTILLDNNPLIRMRLPQGITNLQFAICNLYDPLPLAKSFGVVFFDSPWYVEPVTSWLYRASTVVDLGGTIAFSLFPSLLRPDAEDERWNILTRAAQIGEVRILEDELTYETPLFEREALAESGIHLLGSWRRADLILVTANKGPQQSPASFHEFTDQWESFLIGSQVVKLRHHTRGENNFSLAPVEGLVDYVFPSVSMRDPRRTQIDLWTSRNRVARVGNRGLVSYLLACLAKGIALSEIAESSVVSSIAVGDREALLTNLSLILDIPSEERNGPTHNRPAIRRLQQH